MIIKQLALVRFPCYKELVAGNFRVVEIKGMPMQREFNFVQLQGQEGGLSQAFMRFAGHHSKSL